LNIQGRGINLQRSHKLHSTNTAQKFRSRLNNTLITSLHTNLEVKVGNLDILTLRQTIDVAHEFGKLRTQRLLPAQNLLEEYQDLVSGEVLQVAGRGLERGLGSGQSLPFVGEIVDDVDERGVEFWLWGEAGGVEPFVPV
jgi:hypothetical protein